MQIPLRSTSCRTEDQGVLQMPRGTGNKACGKQGTGAAGAWTMPSFLPRTLPQHRTPPWAPNQHRGFAGQRRRAPGGGGQHHKARSDLLAVWALGGIRVWKVQGVEQRPHGVCGASASSGGHVTTRERSRHWTLLSQVTKRLGQL